MPNARGIREAGFAPGHGPGYATRRRTPGRDAAGSPTALAAGELATVWLNYADPVRFHPDRALWERALGTAQTVIAVDTVLTDSAARARRRRVPGRGVSREGGHGHQPRRPRAAAAPGDRPRQGPLGHARLRRARRLAGPRRRRRRLRARPRRAGPARWPRSSCSTRCRSTPGSTLDEIGGRGVRWPELSQDCGRRLGARAARRVADAARRRHRQRCASARSAACGPPRRSTSRRCCTSCARSRSSSCRPRTRRRSASARATASRSATTARACRAP